MRIVIAGFGPFPGAPSNPSGRLAIALARRRRPALAEIEITSHVFATAYSAVDRDLPKLLARKPDVILIFGLAGRRREVCVETRARNKRSILFPDSGWRISKITCWTLVTVSWLTWIGRAFASLVHGDAITAHTSTCSISQAKGGLIT